MEKSISAAQYIKKSLLQNAEKMPSSFIKDGLYCGHMHEESKSVIFAEYRP